MLVGRRHKPHYPASMSAATLRLTRCPLRHSDSGVSFQTDEKDSEIEQDSSSIVTERPGDSLLMESGGAGPRRPAPAVTNADGCTRPQVGACESDVLLHRLLTMARGYRAEGDVRTATDLYWLLAEEHQETRQAVTAKEVLLEMAAGYERRRAPHTARSIYERLLTDPRVQMRKGAQAGETR